MEKYWRDMLGPLILTLKEMLAGYFQELFQGASLGPFFSFLREAVDFISKPGVDFSCREDFPFS